MCTFVGSGWKGTSEIKGLVCIIPSSALFTECLGSLGCIWFVFPISILVSSGIFCDSSDGRLTV